MTTQLLFAYVKVPHEFMRESPKENGRVVSDAVYSEEVNILQEENGWVQIETQVDRYKGWIRRETLALQKTDFFAGQSKAIAKVNRLAAHIYAAADTEFGPLFSLPYGSRLKVVEEPKDARWIKIALVDDREAYIQTGDVTRDLSPLRKKDLVPLSKKFLNLPYTWGGRSSLGFDCSGFVQMLYREIGVFLPRDSKDQFTWEHLKPIRVDAMGPGDLVFFGLSKDQIRHVGMYIGNNRFIHATVQESKPHIHISNLKDKEWDGSGSPSFRAARSYAPPEASDEKT